MSNLLEGKFALVLGIANKWSLAYAIAQAFSREGATLALTYLGEKQKEAIEDLAADLNVAAILPCDVTKDDDLEALTSCARRNPERLVSTNGRERSSRLANARLCTTA